jgi:hypothetical protein
MKMSSTVISVDLNLALILGKPVRLEGGPL